MSDWILPKIGFQVELKMLSDWHVGSGVGRPGDIDRLIRRDPVDGLPYVPAKTLTGIWRDACERVAIGLDGGIENGPWSAWVELVFGEQPALYDRKRAQDSAQSIGTLSLDPSALLKPVPARLSVRAATLPEDLRLLLKEKALAREALTFVKPGVRIHPRTGRARQDHLRFEEMARAGAVLTAQCSLALYNEDNRRVASALLFAGAQLVERLGGKRRRGAGKCALSILEIDSVVGQPWLDCLIQPEAPGIQAEADEAPSGNLSAEENTSTQDWERIELTVTPKSPVIVPSHTIGNLIETLDYIPGSYLLPIICRQLNAAGLNFGAMLESQALVITNATLMTDECAGRPVPFSLVQEKMGGGLDQAAAVHNRLCEPKPVNEQTRSHDPGYIGDVRGENSIQYFPAYAKPDLTVETHNVIKDEVQRPTAEVGGVFSYQAISPLKEDPRAKEQYPITFRAELRLRADFAAKLEATWPEVLDGKYRIGRASKDDYGLVELKATKISKQLQPRQDETLTVWLLSDVLLRDGRLRPVASVNRLGEAISKKLSQITGGQVSLRLKKVPPQSKVLASAPKQRRTDSWQTQWGFPRPTLAGLHAGTCAVFEVTRSDVPISSDHLVAIELSGIGERRAEGYGQLCFNDPFVTQPMRDFKQEPSSNGNGVLPLPSIAALIFPGGTYKYACLIEREAIRQELQRRAFGFAADSKWRHDVLKINPKSPQPTMSQLGALRSVIAQSRSDTQAETDRTRALVSHWLERIQQSKNRDRAWPKDTWQAVWDLVNDQNKIWDALAIDFQQLILTTSQTDPAQSAELDRKREFWAEAVRTVVDACIRAHKRELEKEARHAT
jgi:CRISPR-associated protein Csx10